MEKASKIISWIFLPLFVPVYVLLIALFIPSEPNFSHLRDHLYSYPMEGKLAVLWTFTIFIVLAPGLSMLLLKRSGFIRSLHMDDKQDRFIPLLLMAAYSVALFLLVHFRSDFEVPKYLKALPLAGALVTAGFALINRWIKISLHAGGVGIIVGFSLAYFVVFPIYSIWWIVLILVLAGCTMTARMYLGKHSHFEIYSGFVLAIFITFALNFLYP